MNNVNMANMGPMGGPVGGPPMMNNGGVGAPQPGGAQRQALQAHQDNRALLNTYIYEYFLKSGMFEPARALLNSDAQIKVQKDSPGGRRDENGNLIGNGLGDDHMDTDSKEDMDQKRPDDLPAPQIPMPLPDSCFLYEWFCLFWDMLHAQKAKGQNGPVSQYVQNAQVWHILPQGCNVRIFRTNGNIRQRNRQRGTGNSNSRTCSVTCDQT
jgi:hypothetical protein